ncbi:MAG: sigma-70 family RNA polymerase sigma factor [Candidatus Saccharibacteria bacterium]
MANEKAFRRMYENHVNDIYVYLYWRTNDQDIANDLTSEVFTKAWRNWPSFDGKYPKAWFFTIAKNQLTDHWRKKRDLPISDEVRENILDESLPTSDVIDTEINKKKLYKAIGTLPDSMQNVIELKVLNSLSAKETGEILGLSEPNVRIIQHRALKRLKEWYEKNS